MALGRRKGLFEQRRSRESGCLLPLILLVVAAVIALSLNALSNRFVRLETRRVTFVDMARALEKFRVLHLSDLHAAMMGKGQENLLHALGKEDYDAVVFSGDMVGSGGNAEPLLDLLRALAGKVPVFFIAGDEDPQPYLSQPHGDSGVYAPWVAQAMELGATYLEAPVRMEWEGSAVWFVPGDLFFLDLASADFALTGQITLLEASPNVFEENVAARLRLMRHRLEVVRQSVEALAAIKSGEAVVAVSHHPPGAESLRELSALVRESAAPKPGLFLCGQFNNGQIRLPGLGPVYIPRQSDGSGGFFPGDAGFTGLSITQGIPVYVNPGMGASGYYPLRLRLFNRPAMTILELTRAMTR